MGTSNKGHDWIMATVKMISWAICACSCSISVAAIAENSTPPYFASGTHSLNGDWLNNFHSEDESNILNLTTPLGSVGPNRGNQLWSYGDATGRVRAWADIQGGDGPDSYIVYDPEGGVLPTLWSTAEYESATYWSKTFTKNSVDSKTEAVILPSFVELGFTSAPDGMSQLENKFFILPEAFISIRICVFTLTNSADCHEDPNLYSSYRLQRKYGSSGTFSGALGNNDYALTRYPTGEEITEISFEHGASKFALLSPKIIYHTRGPIRVDLSRYKHELDLSHINAGEEYVVYYELIARGRGYADGGSTKASIADPLDVDNGGVILETTDQPYTQKLPRICSEIFDEQRYSNNLDGSVTDHYTGLMWQRCPLAYTLDDKNTPIDLSDDRCVLAPSATAVDSWQASLLLAQQNALGNHSDWRVPGVKELETIVKNCLGAQIEPYIFPDTPRTGNFWTNTPDQASAGNNSWLVDFNRGDIRSVESNSSQYTRLVRDSDAAPIVPLPGLLANGKTVVEGDTGTTQLLFIVTLSTPAATQVTVDYTINSPDDQAIDGTDFDAFSDVLIFQSGQLQKEIAVTIYGDTEAEKNERIYLTLSNPSSNSRLVKPIGKSRIIDDDTVTITLPHVALQLEEGDSGLSEILDIPVVLSQPLKSGTLSVDYILRSDTAVAGSDFVPTNGTLDFNAGEQEKFITVESVGNDAWQNDRNFYVDLSTPAGAKFHDGFDNATIYVRLVDDDGVAHGIGLNDTGPPECGVDCPVLAGQDKDTGRDVTANNDTDGIDGFTFTKLDNNGAPLADQQVVYGNTSWDCVEDRVSGLFWEVKKPVFSGVQDIRNGDQTFSWYNSSGVNTNGIVGAENSGICNGSTDCDTEKYIAHVNTIGLCGFNDWRLPNIDELANVVYDGGPFFGLTLDIDYFPNQEIGKSNYARGTWTASPAIAVDNQIYLFNSLGISERQPSSNTRFFVRLVRGNQQR